MDAQHPQNAFRKEQKSKMDEGVVRAMLSLWHKDHWYQILNLKKGLYFPWMGRKQFPRSGYRYEHHFVLSRAIKEKLFSVNPAATLADAWIQLSGFLNNRIAQIMLKQIAAEEFLNSFPFLPNSICNTSPYPEPSPNPWISISYTSSF